MAILSADADRTAAGSDAAAARIEWVRSNCRLLAAVEHEFAAARPFDGMTIGTGIHLEPKTVALLLTLQAGGARLVSTGNLSSTQPAAADYLRSHGVEVMGEPTTDIAVHADFLDQVVQSHPDLLLDNGGDLFVRYINNPWAGLLGGTEETTSGRMRLQPLRARLGLPVLVINDSPIKQFAENRHAVGQSVLESYLRITNLMTNGRRVVVFGYGACGQGVATNFRNAHAQVAVVETDPVARLKAALDGFAIPDRNDALTRADVVITVTGARDVVSADDLPLLKDGVVLVNAGHFPWEIAVDAIASHPGVLSCVPITDGVMTYRLLDGRRVHLLAGGHMVNLAGPRPLGNSIESMDLGFALQARCLEFVARGMAGPDHVVVPVPRHVDEAVANAFIDAYRLSGAGTDEAGQFGADRTG